MAETCLQFQDIFEIPTGTDAERKEIEKKNKSRARVYRAVRYVLKENFDLKDQIPAKPEDFATTAAKMPNTDVAQFIAILGLIQADNWDDPTNGKDKASGDDIYLTNELDPKESFVIDRRFIDAVVEAVKEYTASSKLFNNVYKLMRDEANEGLDKPRAGLLA